MNNDKIYAVKGKNGGKSEKHSTKIFSYYNGKITEFVLSGRQVLGRNTVQNQVDLSVEAGIVSRRHGVFITNDNQTLFQDIGSTNGTYLDDKKLQKENTVILNDGDVLKVLSRKKAGPMKAFLMVVSDSYPEDAIWKRIRLESDSINIGREDDISLTDLRVSRKHASIVRAENGWAIVDNNSKNGVYLNGKRIREPVLLQPLDVVKIAGYLFIFEEESVLYQSDGGNSKIVQAEPGKRQRIRESDLKLKKDRPNSGADPELKKDHDNTVPLPWNQEIRDWEKKVADGLRSDGNEQKRAQAEIPQRIFGAKGPGRSLEIHIHEKAVWNRLRKKTILRDINLKLDPGSLVLILGGSGAGKTTFINAVMGYEPANGEVTYGGIDIYRDYEKMKFEIGYVPQEDLLRMDDVVYDTLKNAAQMRLPENVFLAQGEARVNYTLNLFGLSRERNLVVGKLSGGQRKRLSIAVEYIGNPSLFFLDEPDSGLDAIMAKDLMTNLRQIADQGKIVMVISHSPDRAFELFDKVIVLAKCSPDDSGRLIYYGSPAEACGFFNTQSMEKIVGRINRKDEGGEGLAEYYFEEFKKMTQMQKRDPGDGF